jgi:hypothetical protein
MRALSPSFKSELEAYRQRLAKERADYPRLAFALQVIDRWHDHTDVETIWDTIKEKLPADAATAEQFIDLVLQRWDTATELNERVPKIPDIETKSRSWIKRHLQKRKYGQIARETGLLDDLLERRTRLLGRQGTARKPFMEGWSAKFQELCGQPLDEIVASLTEIAFNGRVTIDMVRRARRERDRSTRPAK